MIPSFIWYSTVQYVHIRNTTDVSVCHVTHILVYSSKDLMNNLKTDKDSLMLSSMSIHSNIQIDFIYFEPARCNFVASSRKVLYFHIL